MGSVEDEYFSMIDKNDFHFSITTNNEQAQKWFDRGMLFVYGFNHNEGIECFKQVIKYDPNCAMAYWAIANALHCNYNKWEVTIEEMNEIIDKTKKACELASITTLTQLENDLINASKSRNCYPYIPTDIKIINKNYVNEMRLLLKNHIDNIEFIVLFIEGLMNLRPWKLWDNEMTLESEEITSEIRLIYSSTKYLVNTKSHPGYSHLFVHLMEMAPTKKQVEEALSYADDLRTKWPMMGHLVHMASHIEMSLGMYIKSVESNIWAIKADEKYAEIRGYDNYYHFYRCHNEHMLIWSAMFTGQYSIAYDSAKRIINLTPLQLLKDNIIFAESSHQDLYHVYIRFGKWNEILQEPLPEDKKTFLITTTTAYYAKGIASAALGKIEDAEYYQQLFLHSYVTVPEERVLHMVACRRSYEVACKMLSGEILYRKGLYDEAYSDLREGVVLEENLPFDEPWGWMVPVRHALGALLLERGLDKDIIEAEIVYRADLDKYPDNIWALSGLKKCLILKINRFNSSIIQCCSIEMKSIQVSDNNINLNSSEHQIISNEIDELTRKFELFSVNSEISMEHSCFCAGLQMCSK